MIGLFGRSAAFAPRVVGSAICLGVVGLLAQSPPATAATITRANITIDAQDPAAVRMSSRLTVRVDGSADLSSVDLYLSRALSVTNADADGGAVSFEGAEVPGTSLQRITLSLPTAIPSGATGVIAMETVVSADAAGIRAGADGGFLLPGSGWFPQVAPESDELPVHVTTFELPEGFTGIAAGAGTGSGPWTTAAGARPGAAWGQYELVTDVPGHEVYRRKGRTGPAPVDRVAKLATALATGLGDEAERTWKVIDVGQKTVAGGAGLIFWDEDEFAAATGPDAKLLERDLGGAIAETFWTEHFRSVGAHAAWLSRSMALYLGDIAFIVLDDSADRRAMEALVIGSRRSAFLAGIDRDRALSGLVPASDEGPWILETRGALLAHMMAEAVTDRTRWMVALGDFRRDHGGSTIDLATFREVLSRTFATHHRALWPLFETTELPDFHISSHGRGTGKHSSRYRVEVENRGPVAGAVEVMTFTAEGTRIRASRLSISPSGKKAVLFDQPDHIAKIVVDPRGTTLQSDVSGEIVELEPTAATPENLLIPSFPFEGWSHAGREVVDFDLDLGDVSIAGFNGYLAPYRTHHGPSGAVLMGRADVTISPSAPFTAGFERTTGQKSLTFYGVKDMWIRFPLVAWAGIEPHLGDEPVENEADLFHRRTRVYQNMFKSYFSDGERAQVPPTGSAMVIFIGEDGQWRGIVKRTLTNGRVQMRLWDHLQGETIWEESH